MYLARISQVDFVLEPGELLFIPHLTPHEVVNLSATCSVSANYIDQTNVGASVAQACHLPAISPGPPYVHAPDQRRRVYLPGAGQACSP